jgi:hypothetical protein
MNPFELQIAALPTVVKELLKQRYQNKQITVLGFSMYSMIRFQASTTGAIDASIRRAFSYAIGTSPTSAGFLAAYGNASQAETNQTIANQTLNGADFLVYGLAANVTPDSEPAYARRVWRETFCSIAIGANTTIPIGRLEMFPGAGGLRGAGQSAIKQPQLSAPGIVDGGAGTPFGFFTNGEAAAGNYFRLNQPIVWTGMANGVDSSFNILCQPGRAIQETVGAARVAGAGVAAFTPPAAQGDVGTYVDVEWQAIGVQINVRSNNA